METTVDNARKLHSPSHARWVTWGGCVDSLRAYLSNRGHKQVIEGKPLRIPKNVNDEVPCTESNVIARNGSWNWRMVKHCAESQWSQSTPLSVPLHPWKWACLYADFTGPMVGKMYLIQQPWQRYSTSQHYLKDLGYRITSLGQWSQFTAAKFQLFCKHNGIHHIWIAPCYPASIGLAERAMKTFKRGIQKSKDGTIEDRITRFLMRYVSYVLGNFSTLSLHVVHI